MPAAKVGFIGLGNMGRPMALNLARHGFSLVVHDVDSTKLSCASEGPWRPIRRSRWPGGRADHLHGAETTSQAESVMAGDRGIVAGPGAGHIVICIEHHRPLCRASTVGHAGCGNARRLRQRERDVPPRASCRSSREGRGNASNLRDLFQAMGKNIFHVGGIGQGLAMKLVNNMLAPECGGGGGSSCSG